MGTKRGTLTKVKCNNKTDGMNPMINDLSTSVPNHSDLSGDVWKDCAMIHDLQCWVKRQNVCCCLKYPANMRQSF